MMNKNYFVPNGNPTTFNVKDHREEIKASNDETLKKTLKHIEFIEMLEKAKRN